MKHENYKEFLELYVLGELNKEKEFELENHIAECKECSEEFAELKKLQSLISNETPAMPTEVSLMNARKRLFNTISTESAQIPTPEKAISFWHKVFSKQYGLAFGSVVFVLIGFLAGYFLFNSSTTILLNDKSINLDKIDRGDVKIVDVNFPDKFSENAEFEFKLAGEKVNIYRGNLNDIGVQKLLATAMKKTENPGFKIRTAKSFSEFLPNNFIPDNKIKEAFINALKTDSNPGVRKSALQALVGFKYDNKIRDALLYVLENDDNASNRMSAINTLLSMNFGANNIDKNMANKLNWDIGKEENEVVKYKTAKLLIGEK